MSINILDDRIKAESVEIQKLDNGETFVFENELYAVIGRLSDTLTYECYSFVDSCTADFSYDTKVIPVDVDLHITRNVPASAYK